jgi:hypothetical protein
MVAIVVGVWVLTRETPDRCPGGNKTNRTTLNHPLNIPCFARFAKGGKPNFIVRETDLFSQVKDSVVVSFD